MAEQCGASQVLVIDDTEQSITPMRAFGKFKNGRCAYQVMTVKPSQIFVKTLKNTNMFVYVQNVGTETNV